MKNHREATQIYVTRKMVALKAFINANQRFLPSDLNLSAINKTKSERGIYSPHYMKIISGLRRLHYAAYTHYAIKILGLKNRAEYVKYNRRTLKQLRSKRNMVPVKERANLLVVSHKNNGKLYKTLEERVSEALQ